MEVNLILDNEEFQVPASLLEDRYVFDHVISHETWSTMLTDDDRRTLYDMLPGSLTQKQKEDTIQMLLSGDNFSFGNPVEQAWTKVSAGRLSSDVAPLFAELKQLKYGLYKQNMKQYHIKLLEELLLSRRRLIKAALETGGIDNIHSSTRKEDWTQRRKRGNKTTISGRAEEKYRRILADCRKDCDLSPSTLSSDEEPLTTPINQLTEEEYLRMLKEHKRKRRMKIFSPELDTRGITMASVIGVTPSLSHLNDKDVPLQSTKHHVTSVESSKKLTPGTASTAHSSAVSTGGRKTNHPPQLSEMREKRKWEGLFQGQGCIYEVYKDPEKLKVDKTDPIVLEGPLPTGQFTSFFSLLKRVFESLNDRKGDINKVTEMVEMYLDTPECRSCGWISQHMSWSDLVLAALCYLGAEVGAVSTFDPLPHFYPIVDFRDRIDHWKWLGNKRDSDVELLVLYNHWLTNLDRALTVVDYTDYNPLPSLVPSSSAVHPSKPYEVERFQLLESQRYSNPQKAFTYQVHGYEAAVGPVKGVKGGSAKKEQQGSRAREHFLLKSERPNCVTILSLVRDACSRLPNGEGTRMDICILLKDSQFVADNVTDSQLNNAVSGALDRLHYEKDPCVRYISSKKMWIYLHRSRTGEEFEHISWACEAANKNRKVIMSRTKLTPKILLKDAAGQMMDISPQPESASSSGYAKSKGSPKIPKSPKRTQKSAGGRTPKTMKAASKRGGAKKGTPSQQTPQTLLKPPLVSITSSQTVDSDAEVAENELPLLSTTQLSDGDHVTDVSSSEDHQMSFGPFPTAKVTDYVKTYGLQTENTSAGGSTAQWLLTAEDSESNISD